MKETSREKKRARQAETCTVCTTPTAPGAAHCVWYIRASLYRFKTEAEQRLEPNSPHHQTPLTQSISASQSSQAYRQEMKALLSVIKN